MIKAQVVNGGQTIRALHRASERGSLKDDVLVPARVITSNGNKDFGSNVAVNQNNQNQLGTGFLRSNDQRVVQLEHALAALGWYLERREGELKTATEEEKQAIQSRIGRPMHGRVIPLKDGAQAYTATFYGQPEIAKKNVSKIFASTEDGGHYERIFSSEMTAERVAIAHHLKQFVEAFLQPFAAIRRRAERLPASHRVEVYAAYLGHKLASSHADKIHQVIPQCALFLCGSIYKDLAELQKVAPKDIPALLQARGRELIVEHLQHIMDFAAQNTDKADKSWPSLLKSNTFFTHIAAYLAGIRKPKADPPTAVQS